MAPHKHWKIGVLCNCGFGPRENAEAMLLSKTASKLEWLRQRPDFQKPEKAQLLQSLEDAVSRHGEKVDPLLPWIAREVKKGRLNHLTPRSDLSDTSGLARDIRIPLPEHANYAYGDDVPFGHLGDWWRSGHPTAQGVDLMQHTYPQVADKVKEWEAYLQSQQEQADQAKAAGGHVLHRFPDDWTVRQLTPDQLEFEGDVMGHCVGGYGYEDQVRNGDTAIVSLRDAQHQPHATMELEPQADHRIDPETGERWIYKYLGAGQDGYFNRDTGKEIPRTPETGQWFDSIPPVLDKATIRQIQGKSDTVPKPEYQNRLKEWFQTFPEETRPNWGEDHGPITDIAQLPSVDLPDYDDDDQGGYGPHGDYGLGPQNRPIDYESTVPTLVRDIPHWEHRINPNQTEEFDADHARALYEAARIRGEIPQLADAVGKWSDNTVMPSYNDLEDHNLDYLGPYPGEEYDPEEAEAMDIQGGEEGWQNAKENYDENRDELYNMHVPSQASAAMHSLLQPHWQSGPPGKEWEGQYVNLPQPPKPFSPTTFSKVARQTHPHFTTGEPCTCPWGGRKHDERFGTVKQGSKMQWLRERPDKRLQTEWGQALLDDLGGEYHSDKTDPLMPWLAREWKKGRLIHDPSEYPHLRYKHTPAPNPDGTENREVTPSLHPGDLEHWGDWFRSNSPTRRGVDLMQHDTNSIAHKVKDWEAELQAKMDEERQMKGQVVHEFPDDWSIRRLENGRDARDEGDAMGHCVGGYRREIENGDVGIYSLRDPKNNPHATIEMRPKYWANPESGEMLEGAYRGGSMDIPQTEGATMWQVQGKGNGPPISEYQNRIRQWVESHEETPVMPETEQRRTSVPIPTDPEMLEYYYEPEHDDYGGYDPYRLNPGEGEVYGLEDTGDEYDEDPFDYEGPPDWDAIVYSLLHDTWRQGQGTEPRYGLNNADRTREIASDMGFQNDPLNDAVRQQHPALLQEFYRDEYDPNPLYPFGPQDQWNAWHKGEMMNRLVGQNMLTQDPEGLPIGNPPLTEIHPDQEKMFGENFGNGEQPWLPYTHQPQPPTRANPTGVFSRVSSVPLYYRWTFSPVNGEVDLNHNGEDQVRYHGDMASDRNEPDLVHGYAYRIGGGYRLTDWDHKAIEDPFVIAQVMRKLRGEKGPANQQDWEPSGDDFERMHQGMPTQAL